MSKRKASPKPRTKPGAKDAAIYLRLDGKLLARLDAAAERARTRMPGMRITRSDLVRNFVERGRAQDENEASG